MHRREYLLATGGIAAATSIGAVAYTAASTERDVTIDIAADDQAIIGLADGPTNAVTIEDDVLVIDTSTDESEGLNPDGTFTYGDSEDPTTDYSFSLTNNDAEERTYTLSLDGFTYAGDAEFTIQLYESDGTLIGDLTPSSSQTITLDVTDTAYAIMDVVTDGLDSTDDMSGTLSINAE